MLKRIESVLWSLGALAVIALGLMITANVAARAIFQTGIPDSVIIVQDLMVAAIVLPLGAATAARAHVAVEFVTNKLSPRARSYLIVFGSLVGMFALLPLLFAGWREFTGTWQKGSFYFGDLGVPKWPGRLIFLIGNAVCWVRLAELPIRDTRTLLAGGAVDDDKGAVH